MTRWGMPGVFAFGTFDTWSPGYLMFMAATHNGISRLYETFGNGGTADTQERTLGANETSRTWYRQNPPLPRVRWSLRNNNNYEKTGLLVSLNYFANNRLYFLAQLLREEQALDPEGQDRRPGGVRLPANDPRLGAQAELLRVLQKQHVEISRATAAFTVTLPGRGRRAAARRPRRRAVVVAAPRRAAADAGTQTADAQQQARTRSAETREFPAGSYIVRMDQPYSRIADALLDYQYWAPNDPQKTPYDDTGWTFPEGFGVQAVRITDPKVLDVADGAGQGGRSRRRAASAGTGTTFAINHNADNALITLRYKLKDADIQMAEEPFEAAGQKFSADRSSSRACRRPISTRRRPSSGSRRTRSPPRRR